jgi:tetratricopeptide (TPR) repeat protein
MLRRTGTWALALAASLAAAAAAQTKPAPGAALTNGEFRLEYIRLLREYIGGDAGRAVAELAKLPAASTHKLEATKGKRWDTEKVSPNRGFTLTPQASSGQPADLSELQMSLAAVMIETEAAFLGNRPDLLFDRLVNAELWLQSAGQSFGRAKTDDFQRRWSLAVGRKLLWHAVPSPAAKILGDACRMFGDDASLQVAFGHAGETTALAAGTTTPLVRSTAANGRRQALSDARTALERALRLDSESSLSVEARMRLAHVYILIEEDRRATPLLEEVLSRNAAPAYRYLAAIMLADIDARDGRIDQATARYLTAREFVPGAQNAYVAHAHALRAARRHDEASGVLKEMLGRAQRVEDPWVQYPKGFDFELTKLEPLRAFVRAIQ